MHYDYYAGHPYRSRLMDNPDLFWGWYRGLWPDEKQKSSPATHADITDLRRQVDLLRRDLADTKKPAPPHNQANNVHRPQHWSPEAIEALKRRNT